MNGLAILIAIAIALAIAIAYYAVMRRRFRDRREIADAGDTGASALAPHSSEEHVAVAAPVAAQPERDETAENERLIGGLRAENEELRQRLTELEQQTSSRTVELEDRERLSRELEAQRAETARYRDLLIDIENNAPPPLLNQRGAPDDLKLIVGVGPVLERMLLRLGVNSYRQIARWSERDIDEVDAQLAEFPGRIRRDAWVTQARALHQSKYGETLSARG